MTTVESGPVLASTGGALSFPHGFSWGASTASYQVEGAATEDGRGRSIWDTFSHQPGNVRGGDTGDIACDNYHRYPDDIELMASLGLNAYRFSISWPRVQPGGRGKPNQKGLDYYRAMLDKLAEHGIAATATLYHWDLPQELQDEGGWAVRDIAERFAEYASIMAGAIGDRVARWITLNEPQVAANHGYRTGVHAPGLCDDAAAAAATHHLLLSHGLALRVLRDQLPAGTEVGITLDSHPVQVLGDTQANLEQARLIVDANLNGLFLEPLLDGRYPEHAEARLLPPADLIADGDLETISQPIDFLGVNYYGSVYLRAGDQADPRAHEKRSRMALPSGVVEYLPPDLDRTPMGWLVDAEGLYEHLLRLAKQAPDLALYITENGCAAEDYVTPEGAVVDSARIRYLHEHLHAVARASRDGANMAGYFVWSLLDNFEWGWGYQKRFGIVFVDFGTQRRIPKQSAGFYSGIVRANSVPPLPATWPRWSGHLQ
ncbi:MAG TPA: GH1 family beta-glucosidase [Streptosporangiaceae bacterium]|jgi:beta-glucosidase|nr:GH1 family beta-glucosidase [Streptosporangiaceae bacterium]